MTASLGVATTTTHAPLTLEALLQRADDALYRTKQNGGNQVGVETDRPVGNDD